MYSISDTKLDDLEERIRQKINITTGYSNPEANARKLRQIFHKYDLDDQGELDIRKFTAAMVQLNFVGIQREIEALFRRYDDLQTGFVDYSILCNSIFGVGLGPKSLVSDNSKQALTNFRDVIINNIGPHGFHILKRAFEDIDTDGSHAVDRLELIDALHNTGVQDVSTNDVEVIFLSLDKSKSGRILYMDFLSALKSGMTSDRKRAVNNIFDSLDRTKNGFLVVSEMLKYFDPRFHPSVASGQLAAEEVVQDLLSCFKNGNSADGYVYRNEFLEYHKSIDVTVNDDDYFPLLLKQLWRS